MKQNIDVPPPRLAQISDKVQIALMWLFIAIGFIGVAYILTCIGSAFWIVAQGLITTEDMKSSSWLSSPTIVMHFGGFMANAMGTTALIVGAVIAIAKKTPFPAISGIILFSSLQAAFAPQVVYSSGIYNDTIKIGCYVWESKDCQDMLGYPKEKVSFNKYNKDDTAQFTPEYLLAFKALAVKPSPTEIALSSMPGAYFLMSPFTAFHFDDVKKKIQEQRTIFEKNKYSNKKEP